MAGVPFTLPPDEDLLERIEAALAVVYLIFNEGYSATAGDVTVRAELVDEALRLGELLSELMPDDAEVLGLQSLMLLTDARRAARVTDAGELVPLDDQDRSLWNASMIERGLALLSRASKRHDAGPYQVQAAIAAVHARAATASDTNWLSIAALYEMLLALAPSPMARLNHAVAVSMVRPQIEALAKIDDCGVAADHYLVLAAKADVMARSGDRARAADLYTRAAAAAPTEPERRLLARRAAHWCE